MQGHFSSGWRGKGRDGATEVKCLGQTVALEVWERLWDSEFIAGFLVIKIKRNCSYSFICALRVLILLKSFHGLNEVISSICAICLFSDVERHLTGVFDFVLMMWISLLLGSAFSSGLGNWEVSAFGEFQGMMFFGVWSCRLMINRDRFAVAVCAKWLYL